MANWSRRLTGASADTRRWLVGRHSLTARLRQRYAGFAVRGVRQYRRTPLPDECRLLGGRRPALVRDVWLCDGDTALVCAHSVLPWSGLRGDWRRLARLGARPLGEVLFADRQVRRSAMQFCRLPTGHPLARRAAREQPGVGRLWARRSVFVRQGRRILVSEVFMPDMMTP